MSTQTPLGAVFKTGQVNPVSGVFDFVGYVDGSSYPTPSAAARRIPLTKGEVFPPCERKAASWRLSSYA
jgi:YjzC-like protein